MTTTQGLRDLINEKIYYAACLGNSTVDDANYAAFKAMELDSLVDERVNLGMSLAGWTFKLAPKVTSRDMRKIVEALSLDDYPLIDDSFMVEVEDKLEQAWRDDFAKEHRLNPDVLLETMYQRNDVITVEHDYSTYVYDLDVDSLVAETKEAQSTFNAHCAFTTEAQWHEPDFCYYCKRDAS